MAIRVAEKRIAFITLSLDLTIPFSREGHRICLKSVILKACFLSQKSIVDIRPVLCIS